MLWVKVELYKDALIIRWTCLYQHSFMYIIKLIQIADYLDWENAQALRLTDVFAFSVNQ